MEQEHQNAKSLWEPGWKTAECSHPLAQHPKDRRESPLISCSPWYLGIHVARVTETSATAMCS